MLEKLAEKVSQKTPIPVYPRTVENVLIAASRTEDFWQIVRLAHEPLNLVAKVIEVLSEEGLVSVSEEGVKLTDAGKKLLEELGTGAEDHTCPKCGGKGVVIDKLGDDVVKRFIEISRSRPPAIIDYDQGYIRPEDTLARVALMDARGDLRGRRIIVLGDDDLVSVAIGLTKMAKEIAVVEIDERLTKFIEKVAREEGFEVAIYTRDLRKPLPEELVGRFDVFETDPPETIPALRLFIGRGIAALRGPRCAGYFGFTLVDASIDKWREFQKILLNEFNVVITDVIRDFNEYVNWEYVQEMTGWKFAPVKRKPEKNWFVSTWYRIETLRGSKGFNEPVEGDIYRDEELATA